MGKKILTLNIGASAVALAEYETGGHSAKLLNYGTAPLAAPLDSGNAETILTPALLQIVREKGIRPGRVAVSVSGQMVFPRIAAIPMTGGGGDRFEQQVRYEVEQNIPFPIDEMICDHQILGDTETGDKSVLIVAAKIEQVESITDALQAAGFSPEIVGVAPFAVTNVLKAVTAGDESCKILLDIGAKTTSLVIVEGEKLYNRSIPVAGNAITKEIAQALGCSPDEAEAAKREEAYVSMGGVTEDEDERRECIAKACRTVLTRLQAEITRSTNFYRSQQSGSAPTKLYLTGGTSLLPQLAEFFQDALNIEVDYLNPFATIDVGSGVDAAALESDSVVLSATAGLALQAGGAAELNLNLMPPSILEAKAEVARIPFVAAGAVALVAAFGLWYVASSSETDKAVTAAQQMTQKANVANQTKIAVEAAKKEEATSRKEADTLAALLAERGRALSRLALVREVIGENLWIASWKDEVKTVRDEPAGGAYDGTADTAEEKQVVVSEVKIRGWTADVEKLVEEYNKTAEEPQKTGQLVVKAKLEAAPAAPGSEARRCRSVSSGNRVVYGVKDGMKRLAEFTVTITFNEEMTACK